MWCTRIDRKITLVGLLVFIAGAACTTSEHQGSAAAAEGSDVELGSERAAESPSADAELKAPALSTGKTAPDSDSKPGAPEPEPTDGERPLSPGSTLATPEAAAATQPDKSTGETATEPPATTGPAGDAPVPAAASTDPPTTGENAERNAPASEGTATTTAETPNKDGVPGTDETDPTTGEPAPAPAEGTAADDEEGDATYDVSVQQTQVDTVLHVSPVNKELPRVEYRPDSRAMQLMLDETRPTTEQIAELTGMLKQLAEELQAALLPSELQITATTTAYPEFVTRLARYAAKDREWREQQRKYPGLDDDAKQAALRDYAMAADEQTPLAEELTQVFLPLGLSLELSAMTECELINPGDRFLRKQKVRAGMKVPATCNVVKFQFKQLGTNGEEISDVETSEEEAAAPEKTTEAPASKGDGTAL